MFDSKRRIPAIFHRSIGAATVGALLSACGGADTAAGGAGFTRPPTPVETAEVSTGVLTDRFEAVGTVEAAESIIVVSEIPGIIRSLPFREGDHVETGALLVQLEDAELSAALARTEAIRDQKQAAFNRVDLVNKQGAGTPQDLDDAAAELKIAEADVALARARLAKTHIVAPFAGRVGARSVSPGAFLQSGTPITQLSQVHRIKVSFSAPERYVPKLKRGARVRISTTAFPGEFLDGTIDVVDPVLDPETRSGLVVALATNPNERFRPGMSANVSTVMSERAQALTIPAESIFAEGEQTLVFVVQADSTVTRTAVSLGLRLRGSVEVLSGLTPGQRVVRAGHQKLFEGAKVLPVESRPQAGGQKDAT
jgi:membrane fusion protein (multidrug efflux system)